MLLFHHFHNKFCVEMDSASKGGEVLRHCIVSACERVASVGFVACPVPVAYVVVFEHLLAVALADLCGKFIILHDAQSHRPPLLIDKIDNPLFYLFYLSAGKNRILLPESG